MASVRTNQYRYIHFPKTAGIWMTQVIKSINASEKKFYRQANEFHGGVLDPSLWVGDKNLPSFAFIRNPFEWYISLYRFTVGSNFKHYPFRHIRRQKQSEDFNTLLMFCMNNEWSLKQIVEKRLGNPIKVSFLGKFERLEKDFPNFLYQFHDKDLVDQTISRIPKQNSSSFIKRPVMTERQIKMIIDSDLSIFKKYYPNSIPTDFGEPMVVPQTTCPRCGRSVDKLYLMDIENKNRICYWCVNKINNRNKNKTGGKINIVGYQ